MKQRNLLIGSFWIIVAITVGLPYSRAYVTAADSSWMNLSQVILSPPNSLEDKEYLGLKSHKSFLLSQIPAKLIIIQCLNLYCPGCNRQVEAANKLYELIQKDPVLSKDVKMIGICAGNNFEETKVYKDQFLIPFPIFPDPNFVIHERFGSPRTPFTILITKPGNVLFCRYGIVKEADKLLCGIKKFYKQECQHDSYK